MTDGQAANWQRSTFPMGSDEEYTWHDYTIYRWEECYRISRPAHFCIPNLLSVAESLEVAQRIAEQDYRQRVRINEWVEFMLSTPPPNVRHPIVDVDLTPVVGQGGGV